MILLASGRGRVPECSTIKPISISSVQYVHGEMARTDRLEIRPLFERSVRHQTLKVLPGTRPQSPVRAHSHRATHQATPRPNGTSCTSSSSWRKVQVATCAPSCDGMKRSKKTSALQHWRRLPSLPEDHRSHVAIVRRRSAGRMSVLLRASRPPTFVSLTKGVKLANWTGSRSPTKSLLTRRICRTSFRTLDTWPSTLKPEKLCAAV